MKYIIFFLPFLFGCTKKIYKNIEKEFNSDSHASVTTDTAYFNDEDSILYRKPIFFSYRTLFGLDNNSDYLTKAEEAKVLIGGPNYVLIGCLDKYILLKPADRIDYKMDKSGQDDLLITDTRRQAELTLELKWNYYLDSLLFETNYISATIVPAKSIEESKRYDSIVKYKLYTASQIADSNLFELKQRSIISDSSFKKLTTIKNQYFQIRELNYYMAAKQFSQVSEIYTARYKEFIDFFNNRKFTQEEMTFYYGSIDELLRQLVKYKTEFPSIYDSLSYQAYKKTIKTNFSGLPRSYLMANAIYTAYRNKVIKVGELKKQVRKYSKSRLYKHLLLYIAKTYGKAEFYIDEVKSSFSTSNNLNDKLTEETFLQKFSGKLVLVDFWASWCGPCRREMPQIRELKKEYNGKNIVFVTVSVDKNISVWQRAVNKEGLENDHSFIYNNADSIPVFMGLRITELPRYILIGKDGKIINEKAPWPSEAELKLLIEKYL